MAERVYRVKQIDTNLTTGRISVRFIGGRSVHVDPVDYDRLLGASGHPDPGADVDLMGIFVELRKTDPDLKRLGDVKNKVFTLGDPVTTVEDSPVEVEV